MYLVYRAINLTGVVCVCVCVVCVFSGGLAYNGVEMDSRRG